MITQVFNFAAETAAPQADMFTALGIDWQMLIFQGLAFLVLVWILAKFVFPPLLKAVDDRQATIEESTKAAVEAEKKAESAEAKIEATLKKARQEAADIVTTAKDEATAAIEKAENQAKTRAERIVSEAHEDIAKEVLSARNILKKDTLKFVKEAAEVASNHVADSKFDTDLVKKSIQETAK
ncbi:MAG: synthase subunit b [Candidatus Saccharibacteria bacterium]|nr:synthase subunit b [Candidatus Saccharibacteria bacterium]